MVLENYVSVFWRIPKFFSRQGNVVVYSQGERIIIPITQEGVPNVIPEKDCYSHNYESGEIRVRVQSGSIPAAEIYPQNADWIKIKEIKAVNENEYDVFLILEKNEGLGRIASLDFKINGRPVIKVVVLVLFKSLHHLKTRLKYLSISQVVFRFFWEIMSAILNAYVLLKLLVRLMALISR